MGANWNCPSVKICASEGFIKLSPSSTAQTFAQERDVSVLQRLGNIQRKTSFPDGTGYILLRPIIEKLPLRSRVRLSGADERRPIKRAFVLWTACVNCRFSQIRWTWESCLRRHESGHSLVGVAPFHTTEMLFYWAKKFVPAFIDRNHVQTNSNSNYKWLWE